MLYEVITGLIGWVWQQRSGVVIQETATDARWYTQSLTPEIGNAASAVSAPILQGPHKPVGVITITSARITSYNVCYTKLLRITNCSNAYSSRF